MFLDKIITYISNLLNPKPKKHKYHKLLEIIDILLSKDIKPYKIKGDITTSIGNIELYIKSMNAVIDVNWKKDYIPISLYYNGLTYNLPFNRWYISNSNRLLDSTTLKEWLMVSKKLIKKYLDNIDDKSIPNDTNTLKVNVYIINIESILDIINSNT